MSKRKNRKKSPNLPEETLRRARQEAGLEPTPDDETDDETADAPVSESAESVSEAAPVAEPEAEADADAADEEAPAVAVPARSRRRSRSTDSPNRARRKTKDYEEMTAAEVAHLLENPTKTVTEEELHQQYGYVLQDLRSMAILAAVLFVGMIVAASLLV